MYIFGDVNEKLRSQVVTYEAWFPLKSTDFDISLPVYNTHRQYVFNGEKPKKWYLSKWRMCIKSGALFVSYYFQRWRARFTIIFIYDVKLTSELRQNQKFFFTSQILLVKNIFLGNFNKVNHDLIVKYLWDHQTAP